MTGSKRQSKNTVTNEMWHQLALMVIVVMVAKIRHKYSAPLLCRTVRIVTPFGDVQLFENVPSTFVHA